MLRSRLVGVWGGAVPSFTGRHMHARTWESGSAETGAVHTRRRRESGSAARHKTALSRMRRVARVVRVRLAHQTAESRR